MINPENTTAPACNTLELYKVLKMLSECAGTEEGAKRCLELKPSPDKDEVIRALDLTQGAVDNLFKFGAPSFSGAVNVNAHVKRAQAGAPLNLRELLDIRGVLGAVRRLHAYRYENDSELATALDGLFSQLSPNKYLEEQIDRCVISEEEMADDASEELARIRRSMKSAAAKIREVLNKYIHNPQTQKYLQEPIITTRLDRFVIPVKAEYRGMVSGMVHDSSSSGATIFVEPSAVVELNNEIRLLQNREAQEIERILYELSALAAQFGDAILISFAALTELDFNFAKGNFAQLLRAERPHIDDSCAVVLKKARHPLIDPQKVVPVDIGVGKGCDTLVITGPNTGGKTVCLKTLGLFALMIQCGLFIPASAESSVHVFTNIFADIGDEQSIEQSLSTFSSHMKNIVRIVQDADHCSLVLLDELGAGTDPVEGAALATAILEYLRQKGATIAATTHYAELKTYAVDTAGVENASLEFDTDTLRPTYRVLTGVPGRSNAFLISERLGLIPEIIKMAQNEMTGASKRLEDVIANLEEKRKDYEQQEAMLARLKQESAEIKTVLDREKAQFDKEREKIIKSARDEARRVVEGVKTQSQTLIAELEEIKRQKDSDEFKTMVQSVRGTIKSGVNKLYDSADLQPKDTSSESDGYVLPRPLKAGDSVLISSIRKNGTVVKTDGDMVTVQTGSVKMKVNKKELRLGKPQKEKKPSGGFARAEQAAQSGRTVKTEVDIRGLTGSEAELELDKFIDDALTAGINTVYIIHGKGTGALRAAVQQYLKHHPNVSSYRAGTFGEGEMGVTVAALK